MVASVKQLRKTAVLRDRSSGDDGTLEQRLYALQDPTGSVQALANTSGQVVERFAYDSLGNAQALDANGNAYSATINFTGTDNAGLIGQYFSGSVFGNGSGSPTADGSQYAWNILYQGDLFNAVAATYNTPNGVLNPGQDSMLAPNPGMQMAGLSAYSQPQGFWGFYAEHEQGIQTGVAVTAGLAATVASFGILAPEAGAGIAAVIAAQAATGAAGGFTTGYLESGFNGGSFTQNLEAGTINGGIGAALGGGLSAAGIFAPYVGRALALGYSSLYGGLLDSATEAGQYAEAFWQGFTSPVPFAMYSGPGGELFQRLGAGMNSLIYGMRVAGTEDELSALGFHNAYLNYVRPGAVARGFNPSWASGSLGARIYDDFEEATGTAFEANTTPWGQLRSENQADMALISRKLSQIGADTELLANPLYSDVLSRVIWFGTEELPTVGPAAQIREALAQAGIPYYVVPLPSGTAGGEL